ncbi:glutamate decarboxylase gad1, partial [Massospora cicadina]
EMSFSKHIDPEKLLIAAKEQGRGRREPHLHSFAYSSRYQKADVPKFKIPDNSMEAPAAYRLVHDELMLDGKPELNCATFLTGWMEPEAETLIHDNINKNFVDADGFPSSMIIHERCISMLAHLWKIPEGNQAIGTVCGGSSEGVILGGLAMKWAWREKRKKDGKDYGKPNVVFGSNAHCCIEKFARYFDVEARIVTVKKEHNYVMDPADCVKQCDENTIGVFSILGSTYTGHFENVLALSKALDELQKDTGLDIPIHVDAASGGFVAPFSAPKLQWGFDVERVVSINASGHKYGLVYAGLGWVVWKSQDLLHKDLIFEMHYLGVTEYSFSLNFSRPSTHLIAQYYNFIRMGREGYTDVMRSCLHSARYLSRALEQSKLFLVFSDVHRLIGKYSHNSEMDSKSYLLDEYNAGLPLVAFTVSDELRKLVPGIDVADISGLVRTKGWLIPRTTSPWAAKRSAFLRIVVKEGMSEEMVDRLVCDIISACNAIIQTRAEIGATASEKSIFEIMEEDSSESPFVSKLSPDEKSKKYRRHKKNPKHSRTFHSIC